MALLDVCIECSTSGQYVPRLASHARRGEVAYPRTTGWGWWLRYRCSDQTNQCRWGERSCRR